VSDNAYDIAIVGGGPAGTAAAITLLRHTSWKVVVIERGDYSEWRAGETLSPGARPLLDYLGVTDRVLRDGHFRSYGTAAAWGSDRVVSRDFLFTGAGEGWNLDRRLFDLALAETVAALGGTLLRDTVIDDPPARFIIDASGRHATYARKRGARLLIDDHLTGLVASFAAPAETESTTLVESFAHGWFYSVPIPGDELIVALMTDADVVRDRGFLEPDAWRRALPPHTRARIGDAPMFRPPTARPAHTQLLDVPYGSNWIAAGEAAVSFDPLSSMGIGYALTSGIAAARAASSVLNGAAAPLASYAADVAKHYDAYRARRGAYYAMERRWQGEGFWGRRG
jgi:flavin-dependent dehydrogenase